MGADDARDVHSLVRALAAEPGRPRVTWYGPGGERIELSSRVLANWVAKTANLLVDELDAGPGTAVLVDLPAHWRTHVWLLATWSVGACVVVPAAGSDAPVTPDVVVTADPSGPAATPHGATPTRLVAVALPALATRFPGLPPGALDAAAEVRGRPDDFVPVTHPSPADDALVVAATALHHGGLLDAARAAAGAAVLPAGVRLLTDAGPGHAVGTLLAPLVRNGSVVLHHDLATLDAGARRHLELSEGVSPAAG